MACCPAQRGSPLRRILKPQLLAAYVTVVGTGIVPVGHLFDALLAT